MTVKTKASSITTTFVCKLKKIKLNTFPDLIFMVTLVLRKEKTFLPFLDKKCPENMNTEYKPIVNALCN